MKSNNTKNRLAGTRHSLSWLLNSCLILFFSVVMMTACRRETPAPLAGGYDLRLLADNFVSPLGVMAAPDNTGRLFVIDQIGKIWIVNGAGTRLPDPFIDVSGKMVSLMAGYDERGLLGLAFHPQFSTNGKFYLYYTAPARSGGPAPGVAWDHLTRISEFRVSTSDPDLADLSTENIILEADHPQFNHNGGTIAFGPDGFLYISIGDGGNSDDVGPGHVKDWYKPNAGGNGQDILQNLLGNILRIDVDHKIGNLNYCTPDSNPFWGKSGADEIYAFGFRNPYRFSFDMGGEHQLYAGDAGQALYEEIDIVTKGGNYGWNVKEGTHCFNTDNNTIERPDCPTVDADGRPLIDPVIEVRNTANPLGGETNAIVGGNIYRGQSMPELAGKYIFGFLSGSQGGPTGEILMGNPAGSGLWSYSEISLISFPGNLGQYLKGFGQDLTGEIYTTTSQQIGPQGNTGKVYKLVYVQ